MQIYMKDGKALWMNEKAITSKREIKNNPYLTFESPESFTLATKNSTKNWDGTLEYSTDTTNWNEWDGTTTLSSVLSSEKQVLFLRGIGNTKISKSNDTAWVLTGSNIACNGNIENLLDYATVAANGHPTMAENCYWSMFRDCTSLIQAPALSATALSNQCYRTMFSGCTNLTQAPALPATTLANECYYAMFADCTSLIQAPALPATTLAPSCYCYMF